MKVSMSHFLHVHLTTQICVYLLQRKVFISPHRYVFVSHTERCLSPTQNGVCLPHRKMFVSHTERCSSLHTYMCSSLTQKGVYLPHRMVFVSHTERCLSPTQKGVHLPQKCRETNIKLNEETNR